MIYLRIILEAIKENLLIIGVGLLGILAMLNTLLPKNSRMGKILTFITKK